MRRLVVLVLTLVTMLGSPFAISAQDASPAATGPSLLSQLGQPELGVALADGAIQAPAEVAAGEVLVVVENNFEFPAGLVFIQLPEGVTIEDALPILLPPSEEQELSSPEA